MSNDTGPGPKENPEHDEVVIGKVVSVNVPRRELRIAPETSHPERFHKLCDLRLRKSNLVRFHFPLEKVEVTKSAIIARVKARTDDEIAAVRGAAVVVPRSERFELPENEYYIDDLVGLTVKDTEGNLVGKLIEVWKTPANDVYRVLDEEGRETLLPAVEEFVLSVDIEAGLLVADVSRLR